MKKHTAQAFVIIIALILLGSVSTQQTFAGSWSFEGDIITPFSHEDDGPVGDDNPFFDEAGFVVSLNDTRWILERMGGMLDRYDGDGRLEECDTFVAAYVWLALRPAEFVPRDWQALSDLKFETIGHALLTTQDVFLLCVNGGTGSLSAHNYGRARQGIYDSLEMIIPGVNVAVEMLGHDPGSLLAFAATIPAPTQAELEALSLALGAVFDPLFLYDFMLTTQFLIEQLGGILDRVASGTPGSCAEFIFYYEFLFGAPRFIYVPAEWAGVYQKYVNSLGMVIDSSRDLYLYCNQGGTLSDYNFWKARSGLYDGLEELLAGLREAEAMLGIAPQ